MKPFVISVLVIATLLLAGNASATEPWEEKLAADGWSPVADRKIFRDTTWYAEPLVIYVPPDGETIIFTNSAVGFKATSTRVSEKDGVVCRRGPLTRGETWCRSLWARGSEVRAVTTDGVPLVVWTWKRGNLENLRP